MGVVKLVEIQIDQNDEAHILATVELGAQRRAAIEGKSHDDELRMRDCRPVCQAEGGELMEKVANGTFHVTFFTNVLPVSVHFRGRAEVGWKFPHPFVEGHPCEESKLARLCCTCCEEANLA
mmetsp:Transcript_44509/g.143121  ORF Transcript_44509/g.143121 Transcript_44509/m.143121 type:complete len:122 (-) Transcript_44509:1474-1839(-)